jgi:hypothetical protein
MKKIIFLLTLLVFITGCTVKNINDEDINDLIDNAIVENNNDYTEIYNGYKLKIPQGMKIVGKNDYNSKLIFNEDNYYLFIDIISKYYKENPSYKENKTSYLSKTIKYDDIQGYIEINKNDEDYYEIVADYNYAKIEAIVPEEHLKVGVYNIIKILSSIEYNDKIIDTLIGENALSYEESEFDLFGSTREEGYFMDYVEEYNEYEETIKDEDVIK